MELRKGMLAISKAGHDKDSWYVVLNIEGNKAALVNGENRSMDRPKEKKLKVSEIFLCRIYAGATTMESPRSVVVIKAVPTARIIIPKREESSV